MTTKEEWEKRIRELDLITRVRPVKDNFVYYSGGWVRGKEVVSEALLKKFGVEFEFAEIEGGRHKTVIFAQPKGKGVPAMIVSFPNNPKDTSTEKGDGVQKAFHEAGGKCPKLLGRLKFKDPSKKDNVLSCHAFIENAFVLGTNASGSGLFLEEEAKKIGRLMGSFHALTCEEGKKPGELPRGICHGDFFNVNILWKPAKKAEIKNGKVSAEGATPFLIDFDNAKKGEFFEEMKSFCTHHFTGNGMDLRESVKMYDAFLSGYDKERKLTKEEKKLLAGSLEGYINDYAASRFSVRKPEEIAGARNLLGVMKKHLGVDDAVNAAVSAEVAKRLARKA